MELLEWGFAERDLQLMVDDPVDLGGDDIGPGQEEFICPKCGFVFHVEA